MSLRTKMGKGKACAELGLPMSWEQPKFPSVPPPAADTTMG